MLDKLRAVFARARPPEAATDEDRAIELIERGNALEQLGQLKPALEQYEAALALAAQLPRAHLNRGNVLLALGDAPGALAAYETALALDPRYVGGHFNRGNACLHLGRLEEALAAYGRAAGIDPAFADAHVATGYVLDELGRSREAADAYRKALVLRPDYAAVHSNLGAALKNAGMFDEAVHSHRRAVELDPTLALAHYNLGNALRDVGRFDEAEASLRQALALQPDHLEARSSLLFCHNYRNKYAPEQLLDEARAYGSVVARQARRYTAWQGTPDPDRCLRVGLVSGDLRKHPVGYFLESVVSALASTQADRIQLIAYATAKCDDSVAHHLKACCQAWHDVHPSTTDEQLAARIHADRVDILVDLSGHTGHNRLPTFAWKPSPVQVSWLGYFATTGVAEIDYLVGDAWTLPASEDRHFTETLWRLPETRLCFTEPQPSPPVGDLPALAEGAVTFGCFNNLSKVNADVVALWARVLQAVPSSRLLLKSPQLQDEQVRAGIVAGFAAHRIPAERLVLEGLSSRDDYLATYGRVDVCLDPFPFTGGTTTAESLWMGVPVVTLAGKSFLSRQGVGLLMNIGLADWIAADANRYVRLAATQVQDLARLAQLRSTLRPRMSASPIMDAPRFALHFEAALRGMWRAWCETGGGHKAKGLQSADAPAGATPG